MALVEQLNQDMIQAMKEKNKEVLSVLRMVKGAMQLEHINHKKELNDELAIDVISREIKTRNESIREFAKGNRQDLIDATQKEIDILKTYLPEQLSEDELNQIIDEVFETIQPTGPSDMGKVMKEITTKVKGKCDMSVVSNKIKEKLSK